MSALWGNLPRELVERAQWCVAGADKAPLYMRNGELYNASVRSVDEFTSFQNAAEIALQHKLSIGFVLIPEDGLACIDLDVVNRKSQERKRQVIDESKWSTSADFSRYWNIVQSFNCYTERSIHGDGLHIWVRGHVGDGKRRDGVELYSQWRFIICTGDTLDNPPKPVAERQQLLASMVEDMNRDREASIELVELDPTEADETIWVRARTAENGDKFAQLCEGKWEGEFPSQSEADLALMSIFTFYSRSNLQCRRMFRQTALGTREKAIKNDRYLNLTLKQIRSRQAVEESQFNDRLLPNIQEISAALLDNANVDELVQNLQRQTDSAQAANRNIPSAPTAAAQMATMAAQPEVVEDALQWPPGLAGAIAWYLYRVAPRPVQEIAIVTALGFLAGVCGRSFVYSGTGLNMYLIVVATSGMGKEALHSGLTKLAHIANNASPASSFIDFTQYQSGSALLKAVSSNPSFVNSIGEFGRRLKRLGDDRDPNMGTFREVYLNLYQKSGDSIIGGLGYSDQDKNTLGVMGAAYSILGETTPNVLYESLTDEMMSEGLLSRFSFVEYKGYRVPLNTYSQKPEQPLVEAISQLVVESTNLNLQNNRRMVGVTETSLVRLNEFDKTCDAEINKVRGNDAHIQIWNRAALKVMKIAALLAVADNYIHPVIQDVHVDWALMFEQREIALMLNHVESGNVGTNDIARVRKVKTLFGKFINGEIGQKMPRYDLIQKGIIPYKYLMQHTSGIAAFNTQNCRLGHKHGLETTLKTLIESGDIMEVQSIVLLNEHKFRGRAFAVMDLS